MDKCNKNNSVNNIQNFMNNKTKNSRNNIVHHNLKRIIHDKDEKIKSSNIYDKSINESNFSPLSNNNQKSSDILYNNVQSSISNGSGKSILKNLNKITSSISLQKVKNNRKINIFNNLLKSINKSSNEISDHSFSYFFKKENGSQDLISSINNTNTKNKNAIFLKKVEKQNYYIN